jgi:DNA primase
MSTTPQREAYHGVAKSSLPERRQPASFRRQIQAVKDDVRIETVVADYTDELRLLGNGRLLGRCVSPEHEDRTSSMTVYTDTQTFKCYGIGCGAQGDVIDLVKLAEGCKTWEAMVHLSVRYGVELPGRPESWYRRQERQKPVRDGIDAAKILVARRRLYRRFFEPLVLATEDQEDRAHDAQLFWQLTEPLAAHLVGTMMGGRQ